MYGAPIPETAIVSSVLQDNPWWKTGKVDAFYSEFRPRAFFDNFLAHVQQKRPKRAAVLMGPRRVGKTVLLHHVINHILKQGFPKKRLFYISLDKPTYTGLALEQLLELYRKAADLESIENCYVFFDEVQYLKDWSRHLKSLVDTYHDTKFVVSGSAAAALKRASTESGAGRFSDFLLPHLLFCEFADIVRTKIRNNKADLEKGTLGELNELFIRYVNFGGYPDIANQTATEEQARKYIGADIIDKVLLKDIPSLYGIRDPQELNRFFSVLAYNTGNETSYEKLSQQSNGVNKDTIKKYIEYLESAFLIHVLDRIDLSGKRFQRRVNFKVHLTSASLHAALFGETAANDARFGHLVESAVLGQYAHLSFARGYYASTPQKGEIDFVALNTKTQKPEAALEVKWRDFNTLKHSDLKNIYAFLEKSPQVKGQMAVTSKAEGRYLDEHGIHIYPAALYAYALGEHYIKFRQETGQHGILNALDP